MNKKTLSESDICDKFIRPAMEQAGWDGMVQVYREFPLRAGRVFDDRIEVESPGLLPGTITPATIARAGSKARNPLVAVNQNTVCQPTTPKWRHTVERLKAVFPAWHG